MFYLSLFKVYPFSNLKKLDLFWTILLNLLTKILKVHFLSLNSLSLWVSVFSFLFRFKYFYNKNTTSYGFCFSVLFTIRRSFSMLCIPSFSYDRYYNFLWMLIHSFSVHTVIFLQVSYTYPLTVLSFKFSDYLCTSLRNKVIIVTLWGKTGSLTVCKLFMTTSCTSSYASM